MKTSTVDLVVTGDETVAVPAAVDAVRRGQRVLVVLRSDDPRVAARLRRLCGAAKSQLTVMANAEVVCVDGVDGVEAVAVRYTRTGRLCGVNTSAFLSCDASTRPPRDGTDGMPPENGKSSRNVETFGDEVGVLGGEVKVRQRDSGRERQGFGTAGNEPQASCPRFPQDVPSSPERA